MNLEDTKLCEQEIQELLGKKLIERTNSQWACQAFYVNNHGEQKRGKKRLVINYKPLNKVLIDQKYPIPLKDELVRKIKGKSIFSKFDLKSGFWQFKIKPKDRYKTAFIVPQGMYQWVTMPMGLKVAPSKFQERIDVVFLPCRDFALCYIDDILIYSASVESHIQHLHQFFKCVKDAGLALSLKKSTICTARAEFLGIEITNGMISLQQHVLKKLAEFPNQFADRKQLQSFTGCLNWISSQYPMVAQDLVVFKSVERSKEFFWNKEFTSAVQKIKSICLQLQPLRLPGDKQLIVYTDASQEAWGGILCEEEDGIPIIYRYASGRFSDAATRYHSIQQEILAAKNCIFNFHLFLIGKPFILRSDLKNFDKFLDTRNIEKIGNYRLIRWSYWFCHFDIIYEHVPGHHNQVADMLSRLYSEKG